MGYQIQYIYEVWHLRKTCEGLLKDYMDTWLKFKQEASSWPDWVGSNETKCQQYNHKYHQHKGILLEYEEIKKNSGLCTVAKTDA